MTERLQKLLSQWGVASRRQSEQLIAAGRIRVNGAIATLGQKADPAVDVVTVDGNPLQRERPPQLRHHLVHKPLGVICTCDDPQGRPTVLELLPPSLRSQGLYPVGRLDAYSTGALIVTNDGDLTHRLTHPRHDICKTYQVDVEGHPAPATLEQWRQGVDLDGQRTRPAQVEVLSRHRETTRLQVILQEGRNRQIRRVAIQLGHPVRQLHRSAIGPLSLGHLRVGQQRALRAAEVAALRAAASPTPPPDDR